VPKRDMDETINSDMEFEEAVPALLNSGPVDEADEESEDGA
jgi:hypothetical protein